ncbi:hypothetical protein GCM10011367_01160 [Marinicauda pacifica]|nr:hypothetical protein GCM10011367_01160 [Marinicauda pacifica]
MTDTSTSFPLFPDESQDPERTGCPTLSWVPASAGKEAWRLERLPLQRALRLVQIARDVAAGADEVGGGGAEIEQGVEDGEV